MKDVPLSERMCLGYPKLTKDVVSNEVGYSLSGGAVQGYGFNPLTITFCSSGDLNVFSRRQTDGDDEIKSPRVERPRHC